MSRSLALIVAAVLIACSVSHAQELAGGFRELLDIIGVTPRKLEALSSDELTDADWEILAQLLGRLEQQSGVDVERWTVADSQIDEEHVGELFRVEGLVDRVDALSLPAKIAARLDANQIYRCQVKFHKSSAMTVLSLKIPKHWNVSPEHPEPIAFRGVLLNGEQPLFVTTHMAWFPAEGVPHGQRLLAKYGMDAALWDEIAQRSQFISPDKGLEAEAFYTCLAALNKAPVDRVTQAVDESIARADRVDSASHTDLDRQIAAEVKEQAEQGLSSFPALILNSQSQIGEMVRFVGVARRAVRIAVDELSPLPPKDRIREYYELEVFTDDSHNYPLVCCVSSLPSGFPTGDAIHAGVRLEGVFFKSWKYRSRKVVNGPGETTTQEQRYTPVVLASGLTWMQEAPEQSNWWGPVVGGVIFVAMAFGLVKIFRQDREERFPDKAPDFSDL